MLGACCRPERARTRWRTTASSGRSITPRSWASRLLPASLDGVPITHLSWGDVRRLVRGATPAAVGSTERRWLRDLDLHLEGYVATQVTSSNIVYVVALSDQEIAPRYTWIDVVEKDGAYFHPIGRGGWPTSPLNYLGFRYRGQLQSVRHVEEAELVPKLGERNPCWGSGTITCSTGWGRRCGRRHR